MCGPPSCVLPEPFLVNAATVGFCALTCKKAPRRMGFAPSSLEIPPLAARETHYASSLVAKDLSYLWMFVDFENVGLLPLYAD
jgi:hypothetical protein